MVWKPSEREEEHFARLEFEKKKKIEEEKHKKLVGEEKKKLQELHYMRCPKCGMELIEIDYKNIKIDKCSECEGVWLDAGELEAVSRLKKPDLISCSTYLRDDFGALIYPQFLKGYENV